MNLFDILKAEDFTAHPKNCKLHLAVHTGIEDPLDVYLRGDFESWQCWQKRRNFEREFVVSLIQIDGKDLWLFAGCFKVVGCADDQDETYYKYEIENLRETESLIGRLVIQFSRPGRQSYLNVERWVDGLYVHELKPEPFSIEPFPGYQNVRLSHSKLDLVVSQAVESWQSALSSVAGVYVITDTTTGKLYVGSATGEGGIWQRWVDYQKTGHGGNKDLKRVLSKEEADYARHFQYAVLETADTHADDHHVLERESHWKRVLDTIEHGYNAN